MTNLDPGRQNLGTSTFNAVKIPNFAKFMILMDLQSFSIDFKQTE
jgi:hypothetical protein